MPAPNPAFRGASLYSGIFDTPDPNTSDADTAPAHASGSTQTSNGESQDKDSTSSAVKTASDAAAPSNKASGWSAALRFAPRRTVAAAKSKARPNAAFVASFTPASATTEELPQASLSRAPGAPPKLPSNSASTSSPSAPQALPATTLATASSQSTGEPERAHVAAVVDTSGLKLTALSLPSTDSDDAWLAAELAKRPVTAPPPFTLPSEELERDRMLIRRAAEARGEAPHHDREANLVAEGEDEDINGFFSTNAGKRAAAKRKKKRRRDASPPPGPNLNAEYDPRIPNDYLAFKQQVYDRRLAAVEYQRWQKEQQDGKDHRDEGKDLWNDEEEEVLNDETRQFNRFPPPPREDARTSLGTWHPTSEQEKNVAPSSTFTSDTTASASYGKAMTGEEAYARRVAMSTMSGEEAYQRRLAMSQCQPPVAHTQSQPSPPGPRPGPPPGPPPSFARSDLTARQTAAAAIAARLAKLVPANPQDGHSEASAVGDPSTFAERIMHKYGHIPGQGIGAQGNRGIATPLSISPHTHKGRGIIINSDSTHALSHSAQQARDAQLYGSCEASRIIVLLNIATITDLSNPARQELVDDIRDECNKFGIVHQVSPCLIKLKAAQQEQEPHDEVEVEAQTEEVRVFVQFSGPAASWKAVRALNGRWFERRQVQAFYYNEQAFARGELNLPLIRPSLSQESP